MIDPKRINLNSNSVISSSDQGIAKGQLPTLMKAIEEYARKAGEEEVEFLNKLQIMGSADLIPELYPITDDSAAIGNNDSSKQQRSHGREVAQKENEKQNIRRQLMMGITETFEEELEDFLFLYEKELGIGWAGLVGENYIRKGMYLIRWVEHRGKLKELVSYFAKERSNFDWPDME